MGFAMLNRHRGPEAPPPPLPKEPTREELVARVAELEAELAALKSADVVINNPVLAAEVVAEDPPAPEEKPAEAPPAPAPAEEASTVVQPVRTGRRGR